MVSCVLRLLGVVTAVRAQMLIQPFGTEQSLCLDLPGGDTTNGALLWLWDCYGGDTQKWVLQNGQLVYAANASKCVDVIGGNSTNGNSLGLWDCNDGESQQWIYEVNNGNRWKWGSSSKCAQFPDVASTKAGDSVEIWDCDYSGFLYDPQRDRQQWEFVFPMSEFILPSPNFPTPTPIRMASHSDNWCIYWDMWVSVYSCWEYDTQSISLGALWHWADNKFVSARDGTQCLGAGQVGGHPGAAVRNCSDTEFTTWAFDADSGLVQLANDATKCLGCSCPDCSMPTMVDIVDCNGSDVQPWTFRVPAPSPSPSSTSAPTAAASPTLHQPVAPSAGTLDDVSVYVYNHQGLSFTLFTSEPAMGTWCERASLVPTPDWYINTTIDFSTQDVANGCLKLGESTGEMIVTFESNMKCKLSYHHDASSGASASSDCATNVVHAATDPNTGKSIIFEVNALPISDLVI